MDGTGVDCPLAMRLPQLRLRELDVCSLTVLGKPVTGGGGTVTNTGKLPFPNVVIGNGGSDIKDSGVPITDVVTAPNGPLTANNLVIGDPALGNKVIPTTIGVTGGNNITNVNNITVNKINGLAPFTNIDNTATAAKKLVGVGAGGPPVGKIRGLNPIGPLITITENGDNLDITVIGDGTGNVSAAAPLGVGKVVIGDGATAVKESALSINGTDLVGVTKLNGNTIFTNIADAGVVTNSLVAAPGPAVGKIFGLKAGTNISITNIGTELQIDTVGVGSGNVTAANNLTSGTLIIGDTGAKDIKTTTIGVTGGNSLTGVNNIALTTINGAAPFTNIASVGTGTSLVSATGPAVGKISSLTAADGTITLTPNGGLTEVDIKVNSAKVATSVTGDGTFITASPTTGAVVVSLSGPNTKGDLIVGDGVGAPGVLPVGADTFLLQADSKKTFGMEWRDPNVIFAATIGTGTDNRIARWNGTGVPKLQDSGITINDNDTITGAVSVNVVGAAVTKSATSLAIAGNYVGANIQVNGTGTGIGFFDSQNGSLVAGGTAIGVLGSTIAPGVGSTISIAGSNTILQSSNLLGNSNLFGGTTTVSSAHQSSISVDIPSRSVAFAALDLVSLKVVNQQSSAVLAATGNIGLTNGIAQVMLASQGVQGLNNYTVFGGFGAGAPATTNRTWELRAKAVAAEGTIGATNAGALVLADTTYVGKTFGDIAEMYENADPTAEIPDGTIVTRDSTYRHKCRIAGVGDEMLGVISAISTLVSGVSDFAWHGQYETTKFGRTKYALDDNGDLVPILNEAYDASRPYVSRLHRPKEYSKVGYSGRVLVRAGNHDWSTARYAEPGVEGLAQPSIAQTRLEVEKVVHAYDADDGYAVVLCLIR